jgi:hypothetical protein
MDHLAGLQMSALRLKPLPSDLTITLAGPMKCCWPQSSDISKEL